jgi:hypothetical protein
MLFVTILMILLALIELSAPGGIIQRLFMKLGCNMRCGMLPNFMCGGVASGDLGADDGTGKGADVEMADIEDSKSRSARRDRKSRRDR